MTDTLPDFLYELGVRCGAGWQRAVLELIYEGAVDMGPARKGLRQDVTAEPGFNSPAAPIQRQLRLGD